MTSRMTTPDDREALVEDFPLAPMSIAATGIGSLLLLNLMIKSIYMKGLETPSEVREELKLSGRIIASLLKDGTDRGLLEILGRTSESTVSEFRYAMTSKGREWAIEALNQSQYIGPAPITLRDYHSQVQKQLVANERIGYETLLQHFSDLILPNDLVSRLGSSVNFGRSILLYGPPGNGKTTIAEAIGRVFRQIILIPYCLEIDGQIIKMFDSSVHEAVATPADSAEPVRETRLALKAESDRRWVPCRRPLVITGGELTLEMLDLSFDPMSKFYEAPLQLKATNGVFIIDDFGRQMVNPDQILNRWIIPLERKTDYLTLHTGLKFPLPFDELVIFSTNLLPKELMDAGTMRRIHFKIEIGAPSENEYVAIFKDVCDAHDLTLPDEILSFLLKEFYQEENIPLARYHPKWIVEQVINRCQYEGTPPRLDRQLVTDAMRNLYTAY